MPPAATAHPSQAAELGTGTAQGSAAAEPSPEPLAFCGAFPNFRAKPKAPSPALCGVLRAQDTCGGGDTASHIMHPTVT